MHGSPFFPWMLVLMSLLLSSFVLRGLSELIFSSVRPIQGVGCCRDGGPPRWSLSHGQPPHPHHMQAMAWKRLEVCVNEGTVQFDRFECSEPIN